MTPETTIEELKLAAASGAFPTGSDATGLAIAAINAIQQTPAEIINEDGEIAPAELDGEA